MLLVPYCRQELGHLLHFTLDELLGCQVLGLPRLPPFQRRAGGHFSPLQLADSGPSTEHYPQSKVVEKHLFQHFGQLRLFARRQRTMDHLEQVPRKHPVGSPWRQAAQLGHLWPQERPEGDLEILEKAP